MAIDRNCNLPNVGEPMWFVRRSYKTWKTIPCLQLCTCEVQWMLYDFINVSYAVALLFNLCGECLTISQPYPSMLCTILTDWFWALATWHWLLSSPWNFVSPKGHWLLYRMVGYIKCVPKSKSKLGYFKCVPSPSYTWSFHRLESM